MPITLKFPDEEWMPALQRALHVDGMRMMRNRLKDAEIISPETYKAREEEIEEIIQELASLMTQRAEKYIKIEQDR